MKIIIDLPEARYKDIQRIASVQLESYYFKTAEQIIANGVALETPPNDNWEGYSSRLWKSAYGYGKADAEQRWIPVSERLPEVDGKYLTTIKVFGSNYNEIRSFANSLYKIDKYDFSDKKGHGWYFYDSEYGYIEETNVIAWMPLPEPYKAESEEV